MDVKYSISPLQLFFFVFACVFSGLFIYGNKNVVVTLMVCALTASFCYAASAISVDVSSSKALCEGYFGRVAPIVLAFSLSFVAFGSTISLSVFSDSVCSYYKNANKGLIFFVCVILCVFAVRNSFCTAARFAQISAFAVIAIFLLCLLGKGGEVSLSFSAQDVPFVLRAIPVLPVIISLYLRTASNEEMSNFAKYGGLQPSKAVCGVLASLFAGAFYLFICAMGADRGILLNIFAYFLCISRFFAYAVSAVDILGIPESQKEKVPKKAMLFAVLCAAAIFLYGILPEYHIGI